jgi:endonuclease/exonuclease/phosphatase family metal-dependent hydrolase
VASVRLATFNILHGRSIEDGQVDLDRLRAAVRALDPDVLALQEVDRDQPRSHLADLTAVAAEAMGAVSHRFAAAISGTPGATWLAATGDEQPGTASYGIALLSRYRATNWRVLRLPRIPARFPMWLPGPGKVKVVREEPRSAVVAQFDSPVGPLTVANTHLSFVPGWNQVQLTRMARNLTGFPNPVVLMGDLNMSRVRRFALPGFRALAAAATFPADAPTRQLDHILVRGTLPPGTVEAPVVELSDHRPLVLDMPV